MHIYKGNPTAGLTDGTQVSEGTGMSPISVTLSATNNEESSPIKLAIRCDIGYQTVTDTIITPDGTTAAMWALAPADGVFGEYGAALTITDTITADNTIFWAKAKAVDSEAPQTDVSVGLSVSYSVLGG